MLGKMRFNTVLNLSYEVYHISLRLFPDFTWILLGQLSEVPYLEVLRKKV